MTRFALGSVALIAGLSACSTPVDVDRGSNPPIVDAGTGDAGVTTGLTYYTDVAPILDANCVSCHRAGDIAPFPLDTAESAHQYAPLLKPAVQSKRMPPWPPGPNTPEMLHERKLTDAQIATISDWATNGAPAGDPSKRGDALPTDDTDITSADFAGDIGVDYVPNAQFTDDYRCFLVDLNTTSKKMVTGFRITPGNRQTVHHVIVTIFDQADRAALTQLDAKSPETPGWQCFGGPAPGVGAGAMLGGWVPGMRGSMLPDGTGFLAPANGVAVVQVHYNLAGGMAPDRTQIELQFAPDATATSLSAIFTLPIAQHQLSIPADAKSTTASAQKTAKQWAGNTFYPDGDAYVVSVLGHMHKLGTKISVEVTRDGTSQYLLDIPEWDFHWQGQYQLKEPFRVLPTDTVKISCTYDNSADHRSAQGMNTDSVAVTWGEGTTDEMCLSYLQVVDNLP